MIYTPTTQTESETMTTPTTTNTEESTMDTTTPQYAVITAAHDTHEAEMIAARAANANNETFNAIHSRYRAVVRRALVQASAASDAAFHAANNNTD